jgi:pyruvate ferredoxin oxidoreductase alpha subunit
MPIRALTGNEAMAEAMRQINPDVVAAYPITPATEIVQLFASFVADGLVDTEFVAVDLYIAAGLRTPIVICEVNRSMSAPINIHCDHSDTMGSREAGWIQIYAEDAQDAYDSVIQAMKISELALLPAMVSTDAFIISHCMQRIDMLEDKDVQNFIGPHLSPYSLFEKPPITIGPLDLQDYFFEHKRQEIEAMHQSLEIIEKVTAEFATKFGRRYGFFETYKIEDAHQILIVCGSTCGTARVAIDKLREKGINIGLLKFHIFRPFPHKKLIHLLTNIATPKLITVLDRSVTMSTMGGPIYVELRAALYDAPIHPLFVDYIYGLGGRDIDVEQITDVILRGEQIIKTGKIDKPINYIGLRE